MGWALLALLASGWACCQNGAPHIGYLYPAGGRQGTTIRAVVGGQFLRNAEGAYASGEGIGVEVVEYVRPLDNAELGDAGRFLYQLVRRRWNARVMEAVAKEEGDEPPLPDHPWLRDLDGKSAAELAELRLRLFDPKKQPNAQIEEQVVIEVTLDPDAPPGDRELRLATSLGLSNPMRFQVGVLPEVAEADLAGPGGGDPQAVDLPVLLNGQIMPGEVDRFRLRAHHGQRLVIRTAARRLVPYLADAVPGWFQATLALYDPQGNRVAYADDYRFDPDPVLLYEVPNDGVYGLEVRDSIYRGRDDFVYRIAVGELPFVTQWFPLGGQAGTPTVASLAGWNLPIAEAPLDTRADGAPLRRLHLGCDEGLCSEIAYAVGDLPESVEAEPNDSTEGAQALMLPQVVNGGIGRPGDVDVFRFEGRADEELVAEVCARRLGSPLDSALRVVDAAGQVVASNDDHDDPETGLVTHQADSYLRVRLPQDGTYWVRLADTQRQGGDAHAYRLRLGPPQPDFALRAIPSTLNVGPGRVTPLTVRAVRKDGFEGEIDVVLADAPAGFALSATRIPADKDSVEAVLSAPRGAPRQTFAVRLEGRAEIGGVQVSRPAAPAEDMMQAFLYRHLVPQDELLVAVTGSRPVPIVWRPLVPGIELTNAAPVPLPLGGTAQVRVKAPPVLPDRRQSPLAGVRFVLSDPPRGVTLQAATVAPPGVTLTLRADANIAQVGYATNAIVEAFVETPAQGPEGRPTGRKQRLSLGVLPAIPFTVVRP